MTTAEMHAPTDYAPPSPTTGILYDAISEMSLSDTLALAAMLTHDFEPDPIDPSAMVADTVRPGRFSSGFLKGDRYP